MFVMHSEYAYGACVCNVYMRHMTMLCGESTVICKLVQLALSGKCKKIRNNTRKGKKTCRNNNKTATIGPVVRTFLIVAFCFKTPSTVGSYGSKSGCSVHFHNSGDSVSPRSRQSLRCTYYVRVRIVFDSNSFSVGRVFVGNGTHRIIAVSRA